jgi:hypothetical protein
MTKRTDAKGARTMNEMNITEQPRSFLEGEPRTHYGIDIQGQTVLNVFVYELTPERVQCAQGLSMLSIMLIIVAGICTGDGALFLLSLCSVFFHGVITQQFANKLVVGTNIVFTPTEFKVLRGDTWDVYDRTIKHSFIMLEHDKAREEKEIQQVRVAKAQAHRQYVRPERIYGDSFHIVFEYFGHRQDVVTVYQEKRATAVAARLRACDAIMDSTTKMGDAPATSPSDQWEDGAGSLPQAGKLP